MEQALHSTELVFILDKSGSMDHLKSDAIGGFNALLEKQKEVKGTCRLTTVLFDDEYEVLHNRCDIKSISPMTSDEYTPCGTTALIDAIGKSIKKMKKTLKEEAQQPDKVLFAIMTDGLENASVKYSSEKVKKMIQKETEKGWEFIFLGANIDAVETAKSFGIKARYAKNFHADKRGLKHAFKEMSVACCCDRIPEDWGKDLEEDFESRKSA